MRRDAKRDGIVRRLCHRWLGWLVLGLAALVVALTVTPLPTNAGHLVVRTSDLVSAAVTTPKIRDRAVTTPKLRNRGVTTAKLRDGAVTAEKLRDRAVTSSKLADGAVGSFHLADGSVRASKLATVIEVQAESDLVANGAPAEATASCPLGMKVIGGGYSSPLLGWRVGVSAREDNGWRAVGLNETGANSKLTVTAYCLDDFLPVLE